MPRLTILILALLPFASSARAEAPLPVEFVAVERTELIFDAALTGTIAAQDSVDMGFRQGGRITEVLVHEGGRVSKGQALARTDPLQQEQALRVAEAAVASAEATEAQARQALERADAMLKRGVGTRAALDAASQGLSAATGGLTQARSALGQAQRALEDTIIRAPTDAIVISRKAEPGQIVGAAQAVLSLASATGREAVFQTADTPLLRDAIGAPVSLSGIDFPELRMTAHVTEIAPLVDPSTGSVTVRAEIEDAPTTVSLLGAAVRGAVHYPAGSGIAVPWTALTAAQGKPAVWLVGDANRVSLAPVQIERFTNGTVILKDGVKPGQIVVGAGAQRLYPGREVTDAGTAAEEE
ncbi:efflux RND transporter periplasmic adaptor subunit [Paracoccus sp. TOH]|uniref:efflux RND transporter periplasmic adaptor subunit n=1 Tax=Paracoccus sp. TOH TaxID=1263728 RepID=UPI0025B19D07|nr:efflux RND transporter periplasmic adaptor subunit [Paracoccus sp. TOH]WJS83319.1 efflux RND transporter periplasmic adaptor subunit [Paracoccus sp. TOH]